MADEWYHAKGDQLAGPVSGKALKELARNGDLERADLVWKEGMEDWVVAERVTGLFPAKIQHSFSEMLGNFRTVEFLNCAGRFGLRRRWG
jgi:hypothetical protein